MNIIKDRYECIVIGGGLGGLTMASMLAIYGIEVLLIEKNNYIGGYITDYKVKDYVFSHSIDWFSGLHEKGKVKIWLEKIGAYDKIPFRQLDIFKRVIVDDFNIAFYSDYKSFEEELIHNFPKEEKNIIRFIELVRAFGGAEWIEYFRPFKTATYMKMLDSMFTDRTLKKVLSANINEDMSAYLYILFLYRCLSKEIYLPAKDELKGLFEIIGESIEEQGVTILKETSVEKIIMDGKIVTGVLLNDGKTIFTNGIVSDVDLRLLYNKLLPENSVNHYFLNKLNHRIPSISLFTTFLGVNKVFDGISKCGEPIVYMKNIETEGNASNKITNLDIKINIKSIYQPFLCKEGKSAIDIRTFAPKGHFDQENIGAAYRKDQKYIIDKQFYEQQLIETSQDILGNYRDDIECIRTATPYTLHRYTNGENGSPMGWSVEPSDYLNGFRIMSPINNLFHVGCWASFPGIEGVVNYCFSLLPRIVRYYGKV